MTAWTVAMVTRMTLTWQPVANHAGCKGDKCGCDLPACEDDTDRCCRIVRDLKHGEDERDRGDAVADR